ncbi:LacI family DNA-binding transcriptional regulator [Bacillus sp. FJAT-27251]|uniref:LacI family DNA-binding transcriptional regulator n=1 Tax=Bacillus sp. FJAT-27251 TaxID=1684142 RepID=UPI0006A7BF92|nr:LacI family DNA-binding transcriptional regulator [Bacillus sp. FJAT-27251]
MDKKVDFSENMLMFFPKEDIIKLIQKTTGKFSVIFLKKKGNGHMKVTLKDIADKVNVSVSTVSRVLNNGVTSIPQETREEIFRISREIGYQKIHDRKKDRKNEKKIGCILYNMKGKYQDPFFSEVIYGIERELLDQGLTLNFTYDQKDILNLDFIDNFDLENLGIIVVGPIQTELLENLSSKIPFVLSVGGTPQINLDYVTVDFFKAAERAVQHLMNLGHRKIACISASTPYLGLSEKEDDRFRGFQSILVSKKISINPDWVQDGRFTIEGGYTAMKKILGGKERPTAIFSASDQMAHGAYRAIQEEGMNIPQDISIVSFDDIEMSKFVSPPLSTVRVYKEEMGRISVKMLLQRMEGSIPLPLTSYLPTELVVRKSCGQLI